MRLPYEFGQGLGLKFMRAIRDGTLRSSSLAAHRPRRCNFEGNLTWATGASVSYGQMFTVKIVIVLPKASGSCFHECSLPLSLPLPPQDENVSYAWSPNLSIRLALVPLFTLSESFYLYFPCAFSCCYNIDNLANIL